MWWVKPSINYALNRELHLTTSAYGNDYVAMNISHIPLLIKPGGSIAHIVVYTKLVALLIAPLHKPQLN